MITNFKFIVFFVLFSSYLCAQTSDEQNKLDYIVLKSGKRIEGEVIQISKNSILFDSKGWANPKNIPLSNIKKYEDFEDGMSLARYEKEEARVNTDLPLDEDGVITFSDVIQVPNSTKSSLYSAGREWFVETFKSADDVLQMEDRESGKLLGKGFSKIYVGGGIAITDTKLYYTIKLYFKEGRYKYEITNLYYLASPNRYNLSPQRQPAESVIIDNLYKPNGKIRNLNAQYKTETQNEIKALIESIRISLAKSVESGDDDW